MDIQKLEDKHEYIQKAEFSEVGWKSDAHAKLSVEFAIDKFEDYKLHLESLIISNESVLTDMGISYNRCVRMRVIEILDTISELKKYLDAN